MRIPVVRIAVSIRGGEDGVGADDLEVDGAAGAGFVLAEEPVPAGDRPEQR